MPIPEWLSPSDPRGKFIWGMVGAVAPEVMRLNRIVTGAARGSYFVISLANSIIGGFAAVALGGDTWANCFIVGAFWPLVVTAFARQLKQ